IPENLVSVAERYRHELIERIAGEDEKLTTKYLEGVDITEEELMSVLRKATINVTLIPVLCGSALKNKGVQLMLDAVVDLLPSPSDLPGVKGIDTATGDEVIREPKDTEPFTALAFKIAADPYVGSLTYFRIYSGVLNRGSYILNASKNNQERVGRILRMHANHREEVDEIYAGDIGALVGLKDTTTGDTLSDPDHSITLESIDFPEPVISQKINPRTKADQEKMGVALRRLSEEDPTFRVSGDQDTGETIISGMGELHLEVLVERMKREFGVTADVGRPQVSYKETITGEAEAEGKYIRQSGGRGQYGHVWLRAKSTERGSGFAFLNEIRGGTIPQEYIPAVEKGVREAMDKGVIAGFRLVDMEVALYDGSYHEVDSSEAAFKIAASMALQTAVKLSKPIILEPIMKVQVIAPGDFLGDVTGDISSKRGRIEEMSDRGTVKVVDAKIPLSEMFSYATKLRSMTEGRGSFTMEFFAYEPVPKNLEQAIIDGKR
ncbi:MAG: elongation factor G, partial [Candidatus Colwellbacteria bacterium]|nr:elongation factor G [Candidatus Colwellbacteria bacterium]